MRGTLGFMSDYVAALATVIAVFVMLRAERKDLAGEFRRMETRIDTLDTKLSSRIDALDTKLSGRIDTVVLELGKAFGRPRS
jgi:hypothetical protein